MTDEKKPPVGNNENKKRSCRKATKRGVKLKKKTQNQNKKTTSRHPKTSVKQKNKNQGIV